MIKNRANEEVLTIITQKIPHRLFQPDKLLIKFFSLEKTTNSWPKKIVTSRKKAMISNSKVCETSKK